LPSENDGTSGFASSPDSVGVSISVAMPVDARDNSRGVN